MPKPFALPSLTVSVPAEARTSAPVLITSATGPSEGKPLASTKPLRPMRLTLMATICATVNALASFRNRPPVPARALKMAASVSSALVELPSVPPAPGVPFKAACSSNWLASMSTVVLALSRIERPASRLTEPQLL